MKGKHLFILDRATIESVDDETIAHTVADLKELDLYRLPYPRVSVRMPLDSTACAFGPSEFINEDILKFNQGQRSLGFHRDSKGKWRTNLGPEHWIEIRNINLLGEPVETWMVHDGSDPKWRAYEINADRNRDEPLDPTPTAELLITLLATKNALKNTHHNTLAKNGVGCKRPGSTKGFEYVTRISVPKILDDDPEHPPRGGMCPHLRRGHIRRQHYGPRGSFIKKIWIEPTFVNADSSFVSTRKAYNVAL